eukprot:15455003-Alexandrium_andersonii.AAC.1
MIALLRHNALANPTLSRVNDAIHVLTHGSFAEHVSAADHIRQGWAELARTHHGNMGVRYEHDKPSTERILLEAL